MIRAITMAAEATMAEAISAAAAAISSPGILVASDAAIDPTVWRR